LVSIHYMKNVMYVHVVQEEAINTLERSKNRYLKVLNAIRKVFEHEMYFREKEVDDKI
jgi:hypothetical protein